MSSTHKKGIKQTALYLITAAIFPAVIFVYFLVQNLNEMNLGYGFAMAVSLFIVTAAAYLLICLILRDAFSAMVFSMVCWGGCYLQPIYFNMVSRLMGAAGTVRRNKVLILAGETIVIVVVAGIITAISRKRIEKKKEIAVFLLLVVAIILAMNAVSLARKLKGVS